MQDNNDGMYDEEFEHWLGAGAISLEGVLRLKQEAGNVFPMTDLSQSGPAVPGEENVSSIDERIIFGYPFGLADDSSPGNRL